MKKKIKITEGKLRGLIRKAIRNTLNEVNGCNLEKDDVEKKSINEAEDYGWVVEDEDAQEAYEFACDYFGKEKMADDIVATLTNSQLAASLAYIFRMNDFREWNKYQENRRL